MQPLIIGIAVIIVLVVLAFTVISIRRQRADTFEERLGRYTEPSALLTLSEDAEAAQKEKEKEKKESALTQKLDEALAGRKFAQGWRTQLARADLKLTVSEYLALHIVSMFGLALVTFFFLTPGQAVQTIIAGGIGFFLPRMYVNNKQGKRLHEFERQLPDLLGLWVNSLRSGYSVLQALEAISREAPPPTSVEIKRVVMEVQLGISMEEAMDHLLMRMPSEDLDLIVTAVNIQREVGGNLAEILEVISHTIRERIKIKGEISVLTAQGRITGYVIAGLPIALGAFLFLINPKYMGRMFENRGCGWPMIAISLGMIGIGWTIINRIVDIEI